MLRIALKILLAVSLLVQGSVGAFAADAAHPRCHGMQHQAHATHGAPVKKPCCPPDCSMPGGLVTCAACGVALIAAPLVVTAQPEPAAAASRELDISVAAAYLLPPMRPPIA